MSELSLAELLWTQAWSGAPLYLLSAVAQGLWLHGRSEFEIAGVLSVGVFSTALTVLASVVVWGRFFAGEAIMLWQVLNLPALIGCLVVFPLVGLLISTGFARR